MTNANELINLLNDLKFNQYFYQIGLEETILLSEKLNHQMKQKEFKPYLFNKEEQELYTRLINGNSAELLDFYGIGNDVIEDKSDWQDFLYKLLGAEYISGDYKRKKQEFLKEVKVILNLNRADFLSEGDKGKDAQRQKDFNKLVREIEKVIKNNSHLKTIELLVSCNKLITYYREAHNLPKTLNFYERYIAVIGFKLFKTFSKYHNKSSKNKKFELKDCLLYEPNIKSYKKTEETKNFDYYPCLLEDLGLYEKYIRETIMKEKVLSEKKQEQFLNYYIVTFLTMYHCYAREGSYENAINILSGRIKFDGYREDIIRKAIDEVNKIIYSKEKIDWNPYKIVEDIGITEATAKKYNMEFIFTIAYLSKKSKSTQWRYANGGKTREEYRKEVAPIEDLILRVGKLKERKLSSREIGKIIGKSPRTVDNYWKKYRETQSSNKSQT